MQTSARDEAITIERIALHLSGLDDPPTRVHAVMRDLGLPLAGVAPSFFDRILARVAEIECGQFTTLTFEAIGQNSDASLPREVAAA